ncbi:chemotaxis protein CheW [Hahella ganghwensis]|uniref:chemotaxis protein CheW n=1 Tax=Hahella ganghwensis TaxID=286420 RepID=UPI00037FB0B6|nr:chemotaxis protein CheW [Hahella ganghwensis]
MSDKRFADPNESDQAIMDYLSDLLRPVPLQVDEEAREQGAPPREKVKAEAKAPEFVPEPKSSPESGAGPGSAAKPLSKPAAKPEFSLSDRKPSFGSAMTGRRKSEEPADHADSILKRAREDWLAHREDARVEKRRPLQELEPPKLSFKPKFKIQSAVEEAKPAPVSTKSAALKTATETVARQAVKTQDSLKEGIAKAKTEVKAEPKQVEEAKQESPDIASRHKIDVPQAKVDIERQKVVEEVVVQEQEVAEDASLDNGTPDGAWPNERPSWAQERFECLLFHVAGLKLAVPLVSLGGVYALDRELTPLFGMPKWFLGLFPHGDLNLNVVDTALWVMPERYSEKWLEQLKYIVRLQDSEWGIGCDTVAEAFTLDPEQVKWRTERSRRPWLAGTVVTHMCALIDVAGFEKLLGDAHSSSEN